MNYQKLIDDAIMNGTSKFLTIQDVKNLKGKKIVTKYFGYKGQDGYDSFIIGDLKIEHCTWGNQEPDYHKKKSEANPREYFNKMTLFTEEGRNTYIKCYSDDGFFWCSDSDRFVQFIEIN